ncbi:MAG TPA: multicopper oxidase family protein [Acidimicrobiales bacterium]|nr:multicopper oxidase family protein [Acidimicrobiales bacterium]
MDFTGPAVWRGLAGFHIVRDDNEDRLGLPSGDHELLIMIVDRSFGIDGNFTYPSLDPTLLHTPGVRAGYEAGVLGDVILVNGAPWPVAHVDGARYRLRILNACNARRLDLRLDPEPASGFVQIGSDGGLLSGPVHQGHLEVAQAERFDVVVDFSSFREGTRVTMTNGFGSGRTGLVMQFIVGARVDDATRVPDQLTDEDVAPSGRVVRHRSFRFSSAYMGAHRAWTINGTFFHPQVTLAEPKAGEIEVWHLVTDFHHPVHLHLNPFRVLARGTGVRGQYDEGWKDTIDLRPAELASILIPFDPVYRGRYPFHCHNLEHEDMAMMANFIVR